MCPIWPSLRTQQSIECPLSFLAFVMTLQLGGSSLISFPKPALQSAIGPNGIRHTHSSSPAPAEVTQCSLRPPDERCVSVGCVKFRLAQKPSPHLQCCAGLRCSSLVPGAACPSQLVSLGTWCCPEGRTLVGAVIARCSFLCPLCNWCHFILAFILRIPVGNSSSHSSPPLAAGVQGRSGHGKRQDRSSPDGPPGRVWTLTQGEAPPHQHPRCSCPSKTQAFLEEKQQTNHLHVQRSQQL